VAAAGKTKVVVMGGSKMAEESFLKMVGDSLEAGAIGMAVGRNVWQSADPLSITAKMAKTIWG